MTHIVRQPIDCARSVYMTLVEDKNYFREESVWLEFANFELRHVDADSLKFSSKRLSRKSGKSESLWLMLADQTRSDLVEYRDTLVDAYKANPNSKKILLANGSSQIRMVA
jgi:hypothetical protein